MSFDPQSGLTQGWVSDVDPDDGRCAAAFFRGYETSVNRWIADGWMNACDESVRVDFVSTYHDSLSVTVCGQSCEIAAADVGCTPEYPWLLENIPETEAEQRYVEFITACTDMAMTATKVVNHSDVVWSAIRLDGIVPAATVLGEPKSDKLFRAVRPDRGTRPLLLPDSAVVIHAPPGTFRYSIEYRQTVAWLPLDAIADNWVKYAVDTAALFNTKSKPFNALVGCGLTLYNLKQTVKAKTLKETVLGVAGTGSSAIGCATKLQDAFKSTRWKTPQTLEKLGTALGKSSWIEYADDSLKLAKRLLNVFPK